MAKSHPPVLQIDVPRARAAWFERQGLSAAEPAATSPVELVRRTGWLRALGGADVYFAVWARQPDIDRVVVDGAVAAGALRIVPAVRGCMYVVPDDDVAPVMALAAELARPRTLRDLAKVDVPWSDIEGLMDEVVSALADGPLDTSALRKALPPDSVRGLGDKGKKIGLSSPLPVALRELEFRHRIQRVPVGQRLDTERYVWGLNAAETPPAVPVDKASMVKAVVERVFQFAAPTSIKEVSTWIGVSQRDVKSAMAELPLVPIEIEGRGEAWLPEVALAALRQAEPESERVVFLGFEDNLLTYFGGPAVFADVAHHGIMMASWGRGKPATLGTGRHPTNRCLMVGDRLVGFWEFDAAAGEVVVGTFEPLSNRVRSAVEQGAAAIGHRIVDVLEHARCFSIDTDAAIARRAAGVRELGGA